ncbi:hypothetical protein LX32DRAFT_446953 [Colletotrichum zoysiae]|uniref:Uncharacterized protein n=1 Tax=Colletotrichum zoysiae TaxID=1216348 RepID=A0AAD9M048_9PEZI|nr:hypothetical protein LX32DRAFT_446953 [Colletotrichum zoysiae]
MRLVTNRDGGKYRTKLQSICKQQSRARHGFDAGDSLIVLCRPKRYLWPASSRAVRAHLHLVGLIGVCLLPGSSLTPVSVGLPSYPYLNDLGI